jgi:hypothetical protein
VTSSLARRLLTLLILGGAIATLGVPSRDDPVKLQQFWRDDHPLICLVNTGDDRSAVEFLARGGAGMFLSSTVLEAGEHRCLAMPDLAPGATVEFRVGGRKVRSFVIGSAPAASDGDAIVSLDDHGNAGHSRDWWFVVPDVVHRPGDAAVIDVFLSPRCDLVVLRPASGPDRPSWTPEDAEADSLTVEVVGDRLALQRPPGMTGVLSARVRLRAPDVEGPAMALFGGYYRVGPADGEPGSEWGFTRALLVVPE